TPDALIEIRTIHNFEFDLQGRARRQTIEVSSPDPQAGMRPVLVRVLEYYNEDQDSRGNVLVQRVEDFIVDPSDPLNKAKYVLVNVRFMENTYDSRGNVRRQTVDNFAKGEDDSLVQLDHQVISNSHIDALNRTGRTEIWTYEPDGVTLMDRRIVENIRFDIRGNAIRQRIETFVQRRDEQGERVFDGGAPVLDRITIQEVRSSYTPQGFVERNEIATFALYIDPASGVETHRFSERRVITNTNFDLFGNALHQTIETWAIDAEPAGQPVWGAGLTDSMIFSLGGALFERRLVTNTYDRQNQPLATAQGNPVHVEIDLWNLDRSGPSPALVLAERQIIENRAFDLRGNITEQVITRRAGDVLIEIRTIRNFDIDTSGNAHYQEITVQVQARDDLGRPMSGGGEPVLVATRFQKLFNRAFDSRGNLLNQRVESYVPDGAARVFLEALEIRNQGFDHRGNVRTQTVDTWVKNEAGTLVQLDHQVIKNSNMDPLNNIRRREVLTYDEAGELVDRRVSENMSFDVRGNVLRQHVEVYVPEVEGSARLIRVTTQEVQNTYSTLGDILTSDVVTFNLDTNPQSSQFGQMVFSDRRVITNGAHDVFGNALRQTVDTWGMGTGVPPVWSPNLIFFVTSFFLAGNQLIELERRDIRNYFGDSSLLARARGNASRVEVDVRVRDPLATGPGGALVFSEHQLIINERFDPAGNVVEEVTTRWAAPAGVSTWSTAHETNSNLIEIRRVVNSEIDSRGQAGHQHVEIKVPDPESGGAATRVRVQEIMNRDFDARGNIQDQRVETYLADGTTLVEVREIRNLRLDQRGRVLEQTVETLVPGAAGGVRDIQHITNSDSDPLGNVGRTEVVITGPGGMFIDRRVIESYNFTIRGVALEQTIHIFSEAGVEIEVREISNSSVDRLGNIGFVRQSVYRLDGALQAIKISETESTRSRFDRYNNVVDEVVRSYRAESVSERVLTETRTVHYGFGTDYDRARGRATEAVANVSEATGRTYFERTMFDSFDANDRARHSVRTTLNDSTAFMVTDIEETWVEYDARGRQTSVIRIEDRNASFMGQGGASQQLAERTTSARRGMTYDVYGRLTGYMEVTASEGQGTAMVLAELQAVREGAVSLEAAALGHGGTVTHAILKYEGVTDEIRISDMTSRRLANPGLSDLAPDGIDQYTHAVREFGDFDSNGIRIGDGYNSLGQVTGYRETVTTNQDNVTTVTTRRNITYETGGLEDMWTESARRYSVDRTLDTQTETRRAASDYDRQMGLVTGYREITTNPLRDSVTTTTEVSHIRYSGPWRQAGLTMRTLDEGGLNVETTTERTFLAYDPLGQART
ncbi:MAG: hypothetical protein HYY14_00150, partial [Candidatus Omnitrophica bacterium]|nr:hypothetical protein [Candidatus Omnitrophota bacterium]